jgi:TorA maturation chaperone TorD
MNHAGADGRAMLAHMRAQVYEVLATLYLQSPSPALVTALLGLAGSPALAYLSSGAAAELFRRYALSYAGDAEALQGEFNDLFAVPLGRYVTPYESVYRDAHVVGGQRVRGLLMGPSTLAVLQAYREHGLALSPECAELPDHIGVELSFMSLLCERERTAHESGHDAQLAQILECELRFLEHHLLRWVPHLKRRIAANARSDFYRGVGHLTEDFLSADRAVLMSGYARPPHPRPPLPAAPRPSSSPAPRLASSRVCRPASRPRCRPRA